MLKTECCLLSCVFRAFLSAGAWAAVAAVNIGRQVRSADLSFGFRLLQLYLLKQVDVA